MPEQKRPSKKQKELLEFISKFIAEHSYGPSYREIMAGCSYSSVATVAVHVNNLIKKGLLQKKDRSARSLEIVGALNPHTKDESTTLSDSSGEKWLMELIKQKLASIEDSSQKQVASQKLAEAFKVLGLENTVRDLENRH